MKLCWVAACLSQALYGAVLTLGAQNGWAMAFYALGTVGWGVASHSAAQANARWL